jgi:predicted glycosyl hydrolase (DUF1957 family)
MKTRTARIAVLIALLVIVLVGLLLIAANRNNPTNTTSTPIRAASGIVTFPALLSAPQQSATARAVINLGYRETNHALRQTNNVVYGGTMTREAGRFRTLEPED